MTQKVSVIVCAHNEAQFLAPCLHSLLAQTRIPDDILVINNASTDHTRAVALQIPGVRVVDEPRKGLVVARETARRHAVGDILVYLDADCRAPLRWLERVELCRPARRPRAHRRLRHLHRVPRRGHQPRPPAVCRRTRVAVSRLPRSLTSTGRRGSSTCSPYRSHPDEKGSARARRRIATLGRRAFGVREEDFDAYLEDIDTQAKRAAAQYGMRVVPGAEVTQNQLRSGKNSHIVALGIKQYISADQRADDILREIRRQGALSIACHPHHRTTRRIEISTCYLWDHHDELSGLVDVWEAANRDDLFSVTSLKHYPYVANSDFHKPKHLYSWKTLVRWDKTFVFFVASWLRPLLQRYGCAWCSSIC
jgi:glycosyltransferase involved in cell wall biosynthesis